MPITRNDLLDADTGEVNLWAVKALARREALATFGSTAPRYLRAALGSVTNIIPQLQAAWRQQHGQPVQTSNVVPFGKPADGVRRSAF
jgi:hypothetical protein